MPVLRVRNLTRDELALAYPLVRSEVHVEPTQWLEFAQDLIDRGGGVLGVRADAQCLYGLATFHFLEMLRYRRALSVELIVSIELGRRQAVRKALLARLGEIARAHACESIVLTTAPNARQTWKEQGYVEASAILVRKQLARDGASPHSSRAAGHE
jgi:hypothetical protein